MYKLGETFEFSVCNVLTLFSVPGETVIVTSVATQRSKIKLSSLKKAQRGQDVGEVEIMQQSFLLLHKHNRAAAIRQIDHSYFNN